MKTENKPKELAVEMSGTGTSSLISKVFKAPLCRRAFQVRSKTSKVAIPLLDETNKLMELLHKAAVR